MLPRILFVDDDRLLLAAFKRAFHDRYDLMGFDSAVQALAHARHAPPFAVVVADMQMPGMNGVEFLQEFSRISPETSRIMLTGQADQGTAVEAVNLGHVFRFLNKPCQEDALGRVVDAGVEQYRLVTAERLLLEDTLTGSIQTMVELLAEFDPRSFGETKRERDCAIQIAGHLGLPSPWDLGVAALLSKIGRLAIPMEIQVKAAHRERLTAQEQELFRKVPEIGSRMIAHVPRLQSVARFILYSAKSFNGEGYPHDGLAGADLPLESRILKVVDDYVAMLSIRRSKPVVIAQMKLERGKYDPAVLAALEHVVEDLPAGQAEPERTLVHVDRLAAGMVLGSDIHTVKGVLMVSAGTRLSGIHIEKLRSAVALHTIENEALILTHDPGN